MLRHHLSHSSPTFLFASLGTNFFKPKRYASLSLLYMITIVVSVLVPFAICVPPFSRLATSNTTSLSIDFEFRQFDWFTTMSIASQPLLDDIDLDGDPDLVLATMDGTVYGYRSILKQLTSQPEINTYLSNWSFVVHGEKFASSPVLVPFDDKGHSLIVIVSVRGVIYALDSDGALIVQIQIPDLTLQAARKPTVALSWDLQDVANNLRWHNAATDMDDVEASRLRPQVYTTALVSRVEAHNHRSAVTDPLDSDAIIIPVNFVSGTNVVVLATLVGIPRRAFISTHLWGSSAHTPGDPSRIFNIHILEISKVQDTQPPFLFASPSLVANPMSDALKRSVSKVENTSVAPSISWHPTYQVLMPSFSGRLHVVPLPLRKLREPNIVSHEIWSSGTSSYSFADSCVLINCGSANPTSSSTVCCLLVDHASRLLLLALKRSGTAAPRRHPSHIGGVSLLWTYEPHLAGFMQPYSEQLGQVTVVRCGSAALAYGDRWAVYPTPDGYLHAVNMTTGLPVSGFPLQLILKDSDANVTFTVGPGLLYSNMDYVQWMLLTDTTGVMYHVSMCNTAVVVRSVTKLSEDTHTSRMIVSPIYFVTTDEAEGTIAISGSIRKLAVIMLSDRGLTAFVPNNTRRHTIGTGLYGRGSHTQPWIMMPTADSVYFVDSSGHPVDKVRMETDEQRLVHYRVTDCLAGDPDNAYEARGTPTAKTIYLAQVIDSFGIPLSDWSIVSAHPSSPSCPAHSSCAAAAITTTTCTGELSITRPFYGSFRGRFQLLVIDPRTGLLISPSLSHPMIGSALLNIQTLWPQLITLWTYLPVVYLFVGLVVLHISQTQTSIPSVRTHSA